MSRKNLVWSSDGGRVPDDKQRRTDDEPRRPAQPAPRDGVVRVSRETKGRKGKGVTLVTGVPLQGPDLKDLAKALKQRCGSGGTVRDGVIEIQGDHRDVVVAELAKKGWTVKKAGG